MKYLKDISDDILDEYRSFFKLNDYVLIKNILTDEFINLCMNSITFNDDALKDKPQFGRKHNNDFGKSPIILDRLSLLTQKPPLAEAKTSKNRANL